MEHLDMKSASLTDQNIKGLYQLYPSVFTEVADEDGNLVKRIDFKKLREILGDFVSEDAPECYDFTWVGKRNAQREAAAPINKSLRPYPAESVNWDKTKNIYIEGDNLEVLKLLQNSYMGKVKMIYIDPPYNTGNDFLYNDDFSISAEEYNANNINLDGIRFRKNSDSNGRFHSDWCSMIYSRLAVARTLLTQDGIIFISIDENEVDNLSKIANEIFGESNFICQLIWAAGRKNDSKYISVSHEYILCYVKNQDYLAENKIVWRERKQGLDDIYAQYDRLKLLHKDDVDAIESGLKQWFKALPDGHPAKDHSHYNKVDKNGIYFADNISWPGGGGPKYPVMHPITHKPVKVPSRGWITNENTLKEWIAADRVDFGPDESYVPTIKAYLKDREYSVPYSVFYKDGRASSKRLATLMGEKVFENPKDEEILSRLIDFSTDDGDIIMDFFSGSATTAHAMLLSNIKTDKYRRFILVQWPEEIDPKKESPGKAQKVAQNAVELLDSLNVAHNICEIGKERIRRAGKEVCNQLNSQIVTLEKVIMQMLEAKPSNSASILLKDDKKEIAAHIYNEQIAPKIQEKERLQGILDKLDTGFRVFKCDESNMKDVYFTPQEYTQDLLSGLEDNIKSDRNDLDLLFDCMLRWGVELSLPVESSKVGECTIHNVNDGDLVGCFDGTITEDVVSAIAATHPLRVVFRDKSFTEASEKMNLFELFKQKCQWSDQEVKNNVKVI